MPYERRDILFYLNDVKDMIAHQYTLFSEYVPKDIDDLNIFEVLDVETLKRPRSDRHLGVVNNLGMDLTAQHGIVFCAQKKGMFNREKEICFMVPARVMLEAIIGDCRRRDIMMPKEGEKSLFVEDIQVGIRIEKKDMGLELEM